MSTARDFRSLDVAIVVLSAVTYLLDVATDVVVIVQYMFEEELMWFTLSLAFVVMPMVLIQIFSLTWQLAESNPKITCLTGFLHFIGLALVKRYTEVLVTWSDVKTSADPLLIEKLFLQINNVFLLRLFETFLESAPQLILQSYVVISTWHGSIATAFSIFFSLISLAWGFATYTDILRLTYRESYQRKWSGLFLQILWQIAMVISRVASIVMFAICFKGWIFLPIVIHWFLMSFWIIAEKPKLSAIWWQDKLLSCVVGFIYIFCFLNVQEGHSRWRMFFFYALHLLENSLVVIAWLVIPVPLDEIYQWIFTAVVFTGFLIGVICLLLFYGCYHPDRNFLDDSEQQTSEEQTVARIESDKLSASLVTSNTSLMNKRIMENGGPTSRSYPYREDPIGGYSQINDNIHFFSMEDGTPSFTSGMSSAINHAMILDEGTDSGVINDRQSVSKIFSSTAIEEEATPCSVQPTKGQINSVYATVGRSKKKREKENSSTSHLPKQHQQQGEDRSKPGNSSRQLDSHILAPSPNTQLALLAKSVSDDIYSPSHVSYRPQKEHARNITSPPPPPYHMPTERRPLGRHSSENIKSTYVSTLDNLSDKYQNWRESWDGSDRYLELFEKYCDHGSKPAKYTYLNSVYQPTTKPMERKPKEGPLTRLRSSFRRHLNAMKSTNYKDMSPVINPNQYFSSQDSIDSKKTSSLFHGKQWPGAETARRHSNEQSGMFYDVCTSRRHAPNSQEYAHQDCPQRQQRYQICNTSGHCLNQGHCYDPTTTCGHNCPHKRMSYSESYSYSQSMENNAPYHLRKTNSLENINSLRDSQSVSHYTGSTNHSGYYENPSSHAGHRTLPHKPGHCLNQYPCSSAFSQCSPNSVYNMDYNHHPEVSAASTYVVYSDKPSVNRCTSAPPSNSSNYGSLRGRSLLSDKARSADQVVDHNDFRYCTVSSRSESAPPSENLIRASYKNFRQLPLKSSSFNTETDSYDFRQLTVSPIQSMSVPPDKLTNLEALRNLTVSPIRSVSVIPNQSSQEQEYYPKYSEQPTRSASVPADYILHGTTRNFSISQNNDGSVPSDHSFDYNCQTQRSISPNPSHHSNDSNLSHGRFTVSSDGTVSIPPNPQTNYGTEDIYSVNTRSVPPLPSSMNDSNQNPNNKSPIFSCKHPYLSERSLSIPFISSQPTTDSDSDSDTPSVTSLSSLPESINDSLQKTLQHMASPNQLSNIIKDGSKTDSESHSDQNRVNKDNNAKENKDQLTRVSADKTNGNLDQKTDLVVDLMTDISTDGNSQNQTTTGHYVSSSKNITKFKAMRRMSSHVHGGVSINPTDSGKSESIKLEGISSQENLTSLSEAIDSDSETRMADTSSIDMSLKRHSAFTQKKNVTVLPSNIQKTNEADDKGLALSNLNDKVGDYSVIQPNQFSLKKFQNHTKNDDSTGSSKTVASVDCYAELPRPSQNGNRKSPNFSNENLASSQYSLPEPVGEEQPKRPQIPKNLPEEKMKLEESLKSKNIRLSPLTIKNMKDSPLKLGRSLSINSADKSRFAKLKQKLSPLRLQSFVNSPFKFGRNIDLFDRKRWRSTNDIVEETKFDVGSCTLLNTKPLQEESKCPKQLPDGGISVSKNADAGYSLSDTEAIELPGKYFHGDESETDSNPTGLGTLIDCDWALDVLDHLSRISDSHGSSFSDDSLFFTPQTSLGDLSQASRKDPSEEDSCGQGNEKLKTNATDVADSAATVEHSRKVIKTSEPELISSEKTRKELFCDFESGGIFTESMTSKTERSTQKDDSMKTMPSKEMDKLDVKENESIGKEATTDNTSYTVNPDIQSVRDSNVVGNSQHDVNVEGFSEKSTVLCNQSQPKMKVLTDQGFERYQNSCIGSNVVTDRAENSQKDGMTYRDNRDISSQLTDSICSSATESELQKRDKPKTNLKRDKKGQNITRSPAKHSRTKPFYVSNKTNSTFEQVDNFENIKKKICIYADAKISHDHDTISIEEIKNWKIPNLERWPHQCDYTEDNDELESLKNSFIREKLSEEIHYPWGSPDNNYEGSLSVPDVSYDHNNFPRRSLSLRPRYRFPKTVSRPVDPLIMPTIFENKMMTEQFIYDDEITDSYPFSEMQLTIPANEMYDDRKQNARKHSLYFHERPLRSLTDSVHPAGYMTVPVKDNSNSWNMMSEKKSCPKFEK